MIRSAVWLLSIFALVNLIASAGAFVAGLWFLDFWISTRSTTLYLPGIAWGVTFSDGGSVLNVLYYALGGSFVWGIVSTFVLILSLERALAPLSRAKV